MLYYPAVCTIVLLLVGGGRWIALERGAKQALETERAPKKGFLLLFGLRSGIATDCKLLTQKAAEAIHQARDPEKDRTSATSNMMQVVLSLMSRKMRLLAVVVSFHLLFLGDIFCRSNARSPILMVGAAASSSDVGLVQTSSVTAHQQTDLDQLPRFETYGPSFTVTLSDPVISPQSGPLSRAFSKSKALVSSEKPLSIDSQFEGLAAKIAARFRISSASSTSLEPMQTPSEYPYGYMLDGGSVMLGPPSEFRYDQHAKRTFPLIGSMMRWSDYIRNVHPEMAYEIRSRVESSNGEQNKERVDVRPFPETLPWMNSVSCGLKWRCFPSYKPEEDYGHKLLSLPHYFRCGTSICMPRVSKILTSWKRHSGDSELANTMSNKRSLDLEVTYRDDSYRQGGQVEFLVGKSSSSLQPKSAHQTASSRRNNHILARFTTGMYNRKQQSSLVSAIEYLRGSVYIPLPEFLHKRCSGMSLSTSYDFIDRKPRVVVSTDVGVSGRTSAVLRLDSNDSTLTVVRSLDER